MSLSELEKRLLKDLPTELKEEFEDEYGEASNELEKSEILKEYNKKSLDYYLPKKLSKDKVDPEIELLLRKRLEYELNVMDYQLKLNPNSTRVIQSTVDGYNFIGARRARSTTRRQRNTNAPQNKQKAKGEQHRKKQERTKRAAENATKEGEEKSVCSDDEDRDSCVLKLQEKRYKVEDLLNPKTLQILYRFTDKEGKLRNFFLSLQEDIRFTKDMSFKNIKFKEILLQNLETHENNDKTDVTFQIVKNSMEKIKNDLVAGQTSFMCKFFHLVLDAVYIFSMIVNYCLNSTHPVWWIKIALTILKDILQLSQPVIIGIFASATIQCGFLVAKFVDYIYDFFITSSNMFLRVIRESFADSLGLAGINHLLGELDLLLNHLSGYSLWLGKSEVFRRNMTGTGIFTSKGNVMSKIYYVQRYTMTHFFTQMMSSFLPWVIDRIRDFMKTNGCLNTSPLYNVIYLNDEVRHYLATRDYKKAFEYIKSNFPNLSFPQKSHSIKATASGWAF